MNKKNVVLILFIFIVVSILVIAFFGVNPVLPSTTVINSVSIYDKENTEIEYEVDDSSVEIENYENNYKYYFYIVLNVDRELDFEELDFKYEVSISNTDDTSFVLTESTNDLFDVTETKEELGEDGFIESYNYYFYYELEFIKNKECSLNILVSRNSKRLSERNINVFFKQGDTGSSDVNF